MVIFVYHFAIFIKAGWAQPSFLMRQLSGHCPLISHLGSHWRFHVPTLSHAHHSAPCLLKTSDTAAFWEDDFSLLISEQCFVPKSNLYLINPFMWQVMCSPQGLFASLEWPTSWLCAQRKFVSQWLHTCNCCSENDFQLTNVFKLDFHEFSHAHKLEV